MERLSDDLRQGRVSNITEGLAQSGLFPDMVVQMVRTGEDTGNLDDMLGKVAEYFEDEAKTACKQLAYASVPIAVLFAAGVVLLLAATFYSGLLGIVR
jgi:type II secretory pathway component PulF